MNLPWPVAMSADGRTWAATAATSSASSRSADQAAAIRPASCQGLGPAPVAACLAQPGRLVLGARWFDPEPRTGSPAWVEAGRCLRLYPNNRLLARLAAATWLPYGDLHHYAHSAHPSVR
ncbi:hypothetical protein [Streptomyces botrytidirepellens]|uniref:hypothetical protein n=1 Tax=Streptomyces botrytidirepellens TaxID=2486417 RepID=UPI001FEAA459|nr:hypothetical protein [Streptomyces botrytidirepellens]